MFGIATHKKAFCLFIQLSTVTFPTCSMARLAVNNKALQWRAQTIIEPQSSRGWCCLAPFSLYNESRDTHVALFDGRGPFQRSRDYGNDRVARSVMSVISVTFIHLSQ
jgi:hypothetical protein